MENLPEKFNGFIIAKDGYKPMVVSGEALKKLAKKRKLLGDDLVFCDYQKVWKKARYVKGLRTFFATHETNYKGELADHEAYSEPQDFDVIASIEQENLSSVGVGQFNNNNNSLNSNFSHHEIHLDSHPNIELESMRDAVEYLRNNSLNLNDETAGMFYAKNAIYFLILSGFGLLAYIIFFLRTAIEGQFH